MTTNARHRLAARKRQHGAVLIVSLLLLTVMTLLGVTAMQVTTLEERMTGNMRDRNVALQAAETALRDAEAFIEGLVNTSNFNGSNGLYGANDPEPNPYDGATWSTSKSRGYSGTFPGVAGQPRYYIKNIAVIDADTETLNIGPGYGGRQTQGEVALFRITVRATGVSDSAQVILQSHYGKRF